MADVVLGAVGATVGFFATGGNPMGALYGAQIGFTAGSMLLSGGSQTVQGPKIGEVASQHGREGIPRPIPFGVARPIGGNIIYSGKPIIRVIREKVSSGGGGKGGGGGGDTYQEREEVYRTYAIRICEGPVNGVRRVWRDNKLVYDALAEPGSTQAKNNAAFLKTATFYNGFYDQMPDPALQRDLGVENVPAYRGTCYMVQDTEDLTPRRGSIPNYVFEVVRNEGFALTSRPYAVEVTETLSLNQAAVEDALILSSPVEPLQLSQAEITSISLESTIIFSEYNVPPEEFTLNQAELTSITLETQLIFSEYNVPPEELTLNQAEITQIDLVQVIGFVEYNVPPEKLTLNQAEITSISLVTV